MNSSLSKLSKPNIEHHDIQNVVHFHEPFLKAIDIYMQEWDLAFEDRGDAIMFLARSALPFYPTPKHELFQVDVTFHARNAEEQLRVNRFFCTDGFPAPEWRDRWIKCEGNVKVGKVTVKVRGRASFGLFLVSMDLKLGHMLSHRNWERVECKQ